MMALAGLLGGGIMFAFLRYMKEPSYRRCPAGVRKNKRKIRARARRMLRNPKNRGNRDEHRYATWLIGLTRKSFIRSRIEKARKTQVPIDWLGLLGKAQVLKDRMRPRNEFTLGPDEDPEQCLVRCSCSARYTYEGVCKLQMLSTETIADVSTHTKACKVCGSALKLRVASVSPLGKPTYVCTVLSDEAYQREESEKRLDAVAVRATPKAGYDP